MQPGSRVRLSNPDNRNVHAGKIGVVSRVDPGAKTRGGKVITSQWVWVKFADVDPRMRWPGTVEVLCRREELEEVK